MNKLVLFLFFPLLVLIQYYVSGRILLQHETALHRGEAVKFRTGIFDPYDPFRGRYVQLRFELSRVDYGDVEEVNLSTDEGYVREDAYVMLETDTDGFAKIKSIQVSRPEGGLYLYTTVRIHSRGILYIHLPFDRYFMNEKAAPEAERLFMEANRSRPEMGQAEPWSNDNYASVRVYKGTAVIESLYVSGKTIETLLKEQSFLREEQE